MRNHKIFDIVDTTLRDGEQTAGIVFDDNEKIEMVKLMDQVGIHFIEAGIPAMGVEECNLMKKLLALNTEAKLIAWNRANINDIKQSIECGFEYIHVSVPISDIQLQYKLRKDRNWVKSELKKLLEYMKENEVKIIIGTEDASRADKDFFLEIAEIGASYQVHHIRYADTIGCLNPFSTKEIFEYLTKLCALPIEFHPHNDLGMATANSISAYLAGVDYISSTVTGIGERAGNVCMEEFIECIHKLYGYELNYNRNALKKLTSLVEKSSGRSLYEYRPVIGSEAKLLS